jgi:hypothetical protein
MKEDMRMTVDSFKKDLIIMAPRNLQQLFLDYSRDQFKIKNMSSNSCLVQKNKNVYVRVSRLYKEAIPNTYLESLCNTQKLLDISEIEGKHVFLNFQQIQEKTDKLICYILFNSYIAFLSITMKKLKEDKMLRYMQYNTQGKTQGRFFISKYNLSYFLKKYMKSAIEYDDLFNYAIKKEKN